MAFIPWIRQELLFNSVVALKRFPITIFFSAATTLLMVYAIETKSNDADIYRYIVTAALGVPLSFAVYMYGERHELPGLFRGITHIAVIGVLTAYMVFFLPVKPTISAIIRFILVTALVHVWVAFAAYPRHSSAGSFWQFNRTLFTRFAVASLFSGVLFVGLVIALVSVDALLGVKINGNRYSELFLFCGGIVHPWFFLAGVPLDLDAEPDSYPAVLRVFAQYILIPLVAIYVVILYLYSAKVIINWEWPRYKATYLVGLFSAPGILATLLLYPLSVSSWVKKYTRVFYLLLLPLVAMMLACVYRRVSEHGLTEMMVVAVAMGCWLVFVSLWMLRTGGEGIRTIPVTLMAILLVISFGPFSAPALGLSSQSARLKAILVRAGVTEGKIKLADKTKIKLKLADYNEVLGKSQYLSDHFGAAALYPFLSGDIDRSKGAHELNHLFINRFLNTEPGKTAKAHTYYSYTASADPVNIEGFSNAIARHAYRSEDPQEFSGKGYTVKLIWEKNLIEVNYDGAKGSFDFGGFYKSLQANEADPNQGLSPGQLSRPIKIGTASGKIFFQRIAGDELARDIEFMLFLP